MAAEIPAQMRKARIRGVVARGDGLQVNLDQLRFEKGFQRFSRWREVLAEKLQHGAQRNAA